MTIRNTINVRELSARLSNIELCAEYAPAGTFNNAKALAQAISDISEQILTTLNVAGFTPANDDRLREVEAVIYGYVMRSCQDSDHFGLLTAEGFGENVTGPSGPRLVAQAKRNRDALNAIQLRAAAEAVRNE